LITRKIQNTVKGETQIDRARYCTESVTYDFGFKSYLKEHTACLYSKNQHTRDIKVRKFACTVPQSFCPILYKTVSTNYSKNIELKILPKKN